MGTKKNDTYTCEKRVRVRVVVVVVTAATRVRETSSLFFVCVCSFRKRCVLSIARVLFCISFGFGILEKRRRGGRDLPGRGKKGGSVCSMNRDDDDDDDAIKK